MDFGTVLGNRRRLKMNRKAGKHYRIADIAFGGASFSEAITYDFSPLSIEKEG